MKSEVIIELEIIVLIIIILASIITAAYFSFKRKRTRQLTYIQTYKFLPIRTMMLYYLNAAICILFSIVVYFSVLPPLGMIIFLLNLIVSLIFVFIQVIWLIKSLLNKTTAWHHHLFSLVLVFSAYLVIFSVIFSKLPQYM